MKIKDLIMASPDETLFDIRKAGEGKTMFFENGLEVYKNRDLIVENSVLWELEVRAIKPVIDEATAHAVLRVIA